MQRFFRSFRRLQWKLMLSYALTTIMALLVLEILGIIIAFAWANANVPWLLQYTLQQKAIQAQPFFAHKDTPDKEALANWLRLPDANFAYPQGTLLIVNMQGRVLASAGNEIAPEGAVLQTYLPPQSATNLQQVLTSKVNTLGLVNQLSNGAMVAIVPIEGSDQHIQGALFQRTGPNLVSYENWHWVNFYLFQAILPSSLVFLIFVGIAGTIFGSMTARGLTRRFKRLSASVDNWSQGNFSLFVKDTSEDEIGQLARQLNRMAEQLQNLLQTRQKLAVLEERNRLARDLHDSVKQQVFAVSMQIGAALALMEQQQEAAQQHMVEADTLAYQARQELTRLIQELRPTTLSDKGLPVTLQEYAASWSRQNDIAVEVCVPLSCALALTIEESLLRVAQEALANVARHSQATRVQIHLECEQDKIVLSLTDNGCGFDPTRVNSDGVGLHSMQERMQALGGTLLVQSEAGQGTCIVAQCACTKAEID